MKRPKKLTPVPDEAMSDPVPTEEVGYARVSTSDQDTDMQVALLKKRGIPDNNIFQDTASGAKMSRPGLGKALKLMEGRPGWTLVVFKLDRLGRDVKGLIELMDRFKEQGWNLVSMTEHIDTRTPFGKFYLHMLASLAQLERDMTVERTKAGMARLREKGAKLGRPTQIKPRQFAEIEQRLLQTTEPIARIARRIKVGKKAISAPTINAWFPGWRSKTKAEREAFRKKRPFPSTT